MRKTPAKTDANNYSYLFLKDFLVLYLSAIVLILGACKSTDSNLTSHHFDIIAKVGDNQTPFAIQSWIQEINRQVAEPGTVPPLESDIPLELNQNVEKWLAFYSGRGKPSFQEYLNRGEFYRPMIEKIFAEAEIPKELYYLALVESGFKNNAFSRSRAVGMWQFMQPTGKEYGLYVSQSIDERRDPVRATHSAAKYLKTLHGKFGSWYLALAAYNGGQGRVRGAIRRAGTNDFWKLVEMKKLPKDTMNYVPQFIAATIIGKHPVQFGLKAPEKTSVMDEVIAKVVPARVSFRDLSSITNVPTNVLREYNPHIRSDIIASSRANYQIWVPKQFEENWEASRMQLASLRKHATPTVVSNHVPSTPGHHKVKPGESLSQLAARYKTSVRNIQTLNNMGKRSTLYKGENLKVVEHKVTTAKAQETYVVKKGDNLFSIAEKFGVSIGLIKQRNQMRSSTIYAGQTLKLQ